MASFILQVTRHVYSWVASFPGFLALSVLQVTEGWAGPGNEATLGCTELTSN